MTKNNMKSKPVRFELNNEVFEIDFTMNALCELEEIYGSIDDALVAISKRKLKDIRTFLWAGLLENRELITQKEVGKMINMGNLVYVSEIITEAFSDDMPEAEEGETEGKN